MKFHYSIYYFMGLLIFSVPSFAQQIGDPPLDPYGYVNKYDTTFSGIGPKVYILPIPRTLEQQMRDTYKEILPFNDTLALELKKSKALASFKNTSVGISNQHMLSDSSTLELETHTLLEEFEKQKDEPTAYTLANQIAYDYLEASTPKKAIEYLLLALEKAKLLKKATDIAILESNLALAYLMDNNLDEAQKIESARLEQALTSKNLAEQAEIYTRIAQIEAARKNYLAAQNTIIRKSIPLYNKSKSFNQKVQAWITLAGIYRSQNKHTEAQWFLIQARDLASEKDFSEALAMIEYMLGSSKMIQKNYKVALSELELAESLLDNSSSAYLQLAITEQIGQALVKLGQYEKAKNYLEKYLEIRQSLF